MSANRNSDVLHDCDELLDLIPDYAFGLTDPETTQLVEANLGRCPEAAEQLTEFRALQETMRADVPQIDPPAALSGRLMVAMLATHAPPAEPPPTPVLPRRARLRPVWWVTAAAILALVLTNLYWFTRVDDLSRRQTELLTMLQSNANAFVLTDTSSLHWARLADTSDQGKASAFMMWNGDNHNGLLYARGFPALKPGETYHLWLTRGDQRVFAGVFQVDDNGDGALLFAISEPIEDFTWARITAQSPDTNPSEPTGEPIVAGELDPT